MRRPTRTPTTSSTAASNTPSIPPRSTPGLLWPGVLLCAFAGLGAATRWGPLPGDAAIRAAVPHLGAFDALSAAAAAVPWLLAIVLSAALLWGAGQRRAGIMLLAGEVLAESGVLVAKLLVDRPRPVAGLPADLVTSAAYPSGHIVRVAVALGIVLLFVRFPTRSVHVGVGLLCLGLVALLALARIASGEHWPSDVLGGLLLAGALVLLATLARRPGQYRAVGGLLPLNP